MNVLDTIIKNFYVSSDIKGDIDPGGHWSLGTPQSGENP